MNREQIKRNILQKIDEISPYQNTDEQYDLLIESMLDDMANRFMLAIPIEIIPMSSHIPHSFISHGTNEFIDIGLVKMPFDSLLVLGNSKFAITLINSFTCHSLFLKVF